MSGVNDFIKAAKSRLGLRPVLPLGQRIEFGAVGVLEDDTMFRYWGSSKSLLSINPGRALPDVESKPNFGGTFGKSTAVQFLAAGKATTKFPELPKASARLEVSLGSQGSCFISARGITVKTLAEPHKLAEAIRQRYLEDAWDRSMVIVYQLGWADHYLGLVADSEGTTVLLRAKADINTQPADAEVSGNFSFAASEHSVTQSDSRHALAFFNAWKIRTPWYDHWDWLKRGDVRPALKEPTLRSEPNVPVFGNA